jgi:hypothetical protein
LVLNFVSKGDEIFQEAFDPGKTIAETFRLTALNITYNPDYLMAESLLLL